MSKESQKPFDQFKYDSDFQQYVTTLKHDKHEIAFSISVEDQYTLDDAIPVAKRLWAERVQRFKDAKALAAAKQLERINCFLEQAHPDLPQLTQTQFRKLLVVPSMIHLAMNEDQICFQFSYLSDSFGEHAVEVSFDADDDSMLSDTQANY